MKRKITKSNKKYRFNPGSVTFNILRLGLILIVCGLFLPLGCRVNGVEMAQGMLGQADFGTSAMFLAPVDDIYAFVLLAVFIFPLIGLIFSLVNENFALTWLWAPVSLAMLIILLIQFNINFDFAHFNFFLRIGPVKKKIVFQTGAYLMSAGYFLAFSSIIFKHTKLIKIK